MDWWFVWPSDSAEESILSHDEVPLRHFALRTVQEHNALNNDVCMFLKEDSYCMGF